MTMLTDVLDNFLNVLVLVPRNLEKPAMALLGTLTLLDISLMILKVNEVDWTKWITHKIIKVGFIIWLIKDYSYILKEIKQGFLLIGNLALHKNIETSTYISNPSLIIDKGIDLFSEFLDLVTLTPSSWVFLILSVFVILSFAFIAFSIVITLIEFYLLTGLSIIFLPFGTLDLTKNYYLNVFKTIVGCCVKLCVLNFILLMSSNIISHLKLVELSYEGAIKCLVICLIITYLIMSIPSFATSLLTGSPALSASEALKTGLSAITATATTATFAYMATQQVKNVTGAASNSIIKGSQVGADLGGKLGQVVGPKTAVLGKGIGAVVGATVGSAYGAGKYAAKTIMGNSDRKSWSNLGGKKDNGSDK